MDLQRYDDVEAFARAAEPFLAAREAEHNLPLGILTGLRRQPAMYGTPPYLAVVAEGADVIAVALRTPPFNVILSLIPEAARAPEALDLLVADLATDQPDLTGVLGPSALSRDFAARWQTRTGRGYRQAMSERIYQLSTVRPVSGVSGRMRHATPDDRAVLERWLAAFHAEAQPDSDHLDAMEWVDQAFASPLRTIALWEEGGAPVSLAGGARNTPTGARVGPVYTPPERRGKGYASACVAALSQEMLDSGRRFCFLFTNLANPTSNHIYQTIGYEPVSDVDVYRFDLGTIPSA
jgi:hypothetical protein